MQQRRLSYLTVEYLEKGDKGTPQIVLIPHPGESPAVPKHRQATELTRENIRERTSKYWNTVWPLVWAALDGRSEAQIENTVATIRGASAGLAKDIFGARSMETIWRIARECELLRIETNLLDVPWEALVNPYQDDESFLAQLTSITRGYLFDSDLDRPYIEGVAPQGKLGLYLDEELEKKWSAANGSEFAQLDKLRRRLVPKTFASIDKLFADMKRHSIIGWICENAYTREIGDRLRVCKDTYCTEEILMTKRLSSKSLLCLISCAEHKPDRRSEQIAAQIALHSGCTVLGPLMPIAEEMGLMFLRLLAGYVALNQRLERKQSLTDILISVRYRNLVGSASPFGLLLLFMGLYGSPNTELG
jgi:hypothetical protein